MTSDAGRPAVPTVDQLVDLVQQQQDQIDDLAAAVETHQRMFESLRAAGLLPAAAGVELPGA